MKEMDYGKGYQYAHDFKNNFVNQEFLPKKIEGTFFYEPGANPKEENSRQFLATRWKGKYGY